MILWPRWRPPPCLPDVVPFAAKEVSVGCVPEALDRVELAVVADELKTIAGKLPVVRVVRDGLVVAKVIVNHLAPNRLAGTVETCADFAE